MASLATDSLIGLGEIALLGEIAPSGVAVESVRMIVARTVTDLDWMLTLGVSSTSSGVGLLVVILRCCNILYVTSRDGGDGVSSILAGSSSGGGDDAFRIGKRLDPRLGGVKLFGVGAGCKVFVR